jgi:putative ABC transport system ATP-binding protein
VEIVRTVGVTKEYMLGRTRVPALRGVDLVLQRGELVALMGPSGSGKSTLLNLIGCLDRPSSGEIFIAGEAIGGRDFDALAELRNRKIGFVFQSFNLIPVLDVRENIEFPCLIGQARENRRELARRVGELVEQVGLADVAHHRPAQLSGGQQQRVAIARALVTRPELVLADEPTANLDTATADQILDVMISLWQREHVTFVFSTHDPRVMARAQRVLRMIDGRIVEDRRTASDVPAKGEAQWMQ